MKVIKAMDFDKHSNLSKQIRCAVKKVVSDLGIGPHCWSIATANRRLGCSAEESKHLESELVDDLVLAVGKVIVNFDMEDSE